MKFKTKALNTQHLVVLAYELSHRTFSPHLTHPKLQKSLWAPKPPFPLVLSRFEPLMASLAQLAMYAFRMPFE